MFQSLEYSGINFIHFYTLVKSLCLAWIGRLLGHLDDKWKAILNSSFEFTTMLAYPFFSNAITMPEP